MQGNVSELVRESRNTGVRGSRSGVAGTMPGCLAAVNRATRNAAGKKAGITGCCISPARGREVRA